MKTLRLLILLSAALLATLAPPRAQANLEVSFDFFYDSLSPHGEWLEVADYGYAWRPIDVDRDWAPYADGYWAFTDAGWTWVSYEDFGGIVYHYGRWIFVNGEGWCWVPGYEWGPAWVSWRSSDDYVGWAPLPPEARWQPSVGISVWADRQYDIGPGYYSFCRVRDFGAPVLRPVIINRVENVTIIRRTVNITNITYNTHYGDRRVIYNGGPNYAKINRHSARPVPALKLVQNVEINLTSSRNDNRERDGLGREGQRGVFNARAEGNQLVVTAPVVRPPEKGAAKRPQARRTVAADKVTRGWNAVKNEGVRSELRQEMQRQTRGLTPETAPAQPVAATDLQAVPAKADPKAASPVVTRERPDRGERSDRGDRGERKSDGPGQPTAPTVAGPKERPPTERPGRESERGTGARGAEPPVASQPGLAPFNPTADREPPRSPVEVPALTPAAPPEVRPEDVPARTRDPRSRPMAEDSQKTDRNADRRREMTRPDADAMKALAEQERTRRRQAEATAEAQRGAAMQRDAEAQRQQQAERLQGERQKAEAGARQKEMETTRQRAEDGRRMQEEAQIRARQETVAAQRKQMEAQQQAVQEAAREKGAARARQQEEESRRRQLEAGEQQRRQVMEQQQAAQDALRQQAERASGESRRQRERDAGNAPPPQEPRRSREEMRPPREPQAAPQPSPEPAPAAPGEADPERRDRGRGRKE